MSTGMSRGSQNAKLLPPEPPQIYEYWLAKVVVAHREEHHCPGDVDSFLEISDEALNNPTEAQVATARQLHAADEERYKKEVEAYRESLKPGK
jgi:hypothetical protein